MAKPLRRIGAAEFARRLGGIANQPDKRFAFFIGAGGSVSSKIPTAASLVWDHWLPRLRDLRAPHRQDLHEWAREALAGSNGHVYDPDDPAASYGAAIQELFLHQEDRQREIERLCEGRFPAFGYAVLAGLMAMDGGRFNIVLTTNFDDLVADALYLYSAARPLVIHHESLANFIRPTRTRPLIVKLHGDHRLSPQNTSEETAKLKGEIQQQLRTLLHDRGLVFLGYGGNDEGIKKMLEGLLPEALPLGVYWLSRVEPACALREWLEKRQAVWVEAGDFDEAMLLIRDTFDLQHPESSRFDKVFQGYFDSYQGLSKRLRQAEITTPDSTSLKEAAQRADEAFEDWWAVEVAASRLEDSDHDRAQAVYEQGLQQFPQSPPLLGLYAVFLETIRKDYDRAEEHFRRAVEADPKDADNLANYAVFLKNIRKDYDRAEEHFRRAVEADPKDARHLGNYALFLKNIRKDYDRGEEYYRRALEADPNDARHLGNYALFLTNIRKDYDRAEEHFRRALEADPKDVNQLRNYAYFLANSKDYDRAEEHYQRALEADPKDANNLGNYSGFLLSRGRYEEGLALLDRALAAEGLSENPALAAECWLWPRAPSARETNRGARETEGDPVGRWSLARLGSRSPPRTGQGPRACRPALAREARRGDQRRRRHRYAGRLGMRGAAVTLASTSRRTFDLEQKIREDGERIRLRLE